MILAAEKNGVTVDIAGIVPPDEKILQLLANAITQCATNAVRHAGADRLKVIVQSEDAHSDDVQSEDERIRIEITNNGVPPKETIKETGGLASVRKLAEDLGAEMIVESQPVFRLTLLIPVS